MTGPMTVPNPTAERAIPIFSPSRAGSQVSARRASPADQVAAAAIPWTTRATIRWVAVAEKPKSAVARARRSIPTTMSGRRPTRSERRPIGMEKRRSIAA